MCIFRFLCQPNFIGKALVVICIIIFSGCEFVIGAIDVQWGVVLYEHQPIFEVGVDGLDRNGLSSFSETEIANLLAELWFEETNGFEVSNTFSEETGILLGAIAIVLPGFYVETNSLKIRKESDYSANAPGNPNYHWRIDRDDTIRISSLNSRPESEPTVVVNGQRMKVSSGANLKLAASSITMAGVRADKHIEQIQSVRSNKFLVVFGAIAFLLVIVCMIKLFMFTRKIG